MKKIPLNHVVYYDHFREMVDGLAERYGESTAFTCYDRKGARSDFSYNRLLKDTNAFCEALVLQGLAGEHIAIVGGNGYPWLVAFFGIVCAGGAAICIDIEQPDSTICEMIRRADAKAVAVAADMLDVVKPVLEDSQVGFVVLLDADSETYTGMDQFCARREAGIADGGGAHGEVRIDKDQCAAIIYTSGTTSTAKPVMLSHYAMCTNAVDALVLVEPPKKAFTGLPLYHAYGLTTAVLACLNAGMGICVNGDLKTTFRDLELYRPGFLAAVPLLAEVLHKQVWDKIEKKGQKRQVLFLMKLFRLIGKPEWLRRTALKELDKSAIGSIRMMICGGAHLSKEVGMDLLSFGIKVLQGYGITECSPVVTVNSDKDVDVVSVGRVFPHFEVRLKDGEVLVRGASLMSGYYKDPELTGAAFDDGWFKTGDLGRFNRRGHLMITGRKKNLIILKNGKKIPAEEIEAHMEAVPIVKEVMAYGATSGNSTDDVKLAVMVYPDPQKTEGMSSYEILSVLQAEVDRINGAYPSYKQIQMINIRGDEFEKTALRKIKRQVV